LPLVEIDLKLDGELIDIDLAGRLPTIDHRNELRVKGVKELAKIGGRTISELLNLMGG
jgi:hypothetical protein